MSNERFEENIQIVEKKFGDARHRQMSPAVPRDESTVNSLI